MTTTMTTNRRKLLGNNGLVVVKTQSPLDKIGLNSDIWKHFKQMFAIWEQDVGGSSHAKNRRQNPFGGLFLMRAQIYFGQDVL